MIKIDIKIRYYILLKLILSDKIYLIMSTVKVILDRIDTFKVDRSLTELVINETLTRSERSEIHEHVKNNGLYSFSSLKAGSSNKYMTITRFKDHDRDVDEDDFIIDDNMIKIFSDWSHIPIPVPLPEYLEYYLEILDPYYDAKKIFALFKSECIKFKSLQRMKDEMNIVIDKIITHIRAKPEFEIFRKMKEETPNISTNKQFYSINQSGKKFISIDIKSANFTVMRSYYPNIFDGKTTWIEFISQFTDSQFIINCKFLRELVFGKLGVASQILKLCFIFIDKVMKSVEGLKYASLKYASFLRNNVTSITNDEVIYEIPLNYDVDIFNHIKSHIDQQFPLMFHVKCFTLQKLGTEPYFVKEFSQIEGKSVEFKCCPKKFIMQCIKFYEGNPIINIDLKFLDEGYVATYDNSIFN